MYPSNQPDPFWKSLPYETLIRIAKIAKDQKKGLYPFFRDPKAMIALREHLVELKLAQLEQQTRRIA